MDALTTALKAQGVKPVLIQGYTNISQDVTPVVLALKQSGADILCTCMTHSRAVGIFANPSRLLGVNAEWVGSPSVVTDMAMKLADTARHNVCGIADFTPYANAESKPCTAKVRINDRLDPDAYSRKGLSLAIGNAKSTAPEPIRKAIVATKGWKGDGVCE